MSSPPEVSLLGDDDSEYFRQVHGRTLNSLNLNYPLPVDMDEVKVSCVKTRGYRIGRLMVLLQRSELHHRLLQFVFGGRNYIGPVKKALQFGQHRRSTLANMSRFRHTKLTSASSP